MNKGSKFQTIPSLNDFKIPFKLEEKALLNWLIDLTRYQGREACMQTISLLRALNKADVPVKNPLDFLKYIDEYLKLYIKSLEHPCWEAGFPLSREEMGYAEIICWNYLFLGESFFIAADLEYKNNIITALAMALQSLGQAQLHIAAAYAIPNDGFWSLLYQIFTWAEKRKLLHLPIEGDDFKGLTLNTLFARCLIFQVCDTNQFHSRDMRTIFNFLPKVCVDLPISIYPDEQLGVFMLDLESDKPPLNVKAQLELAGPNVRYFSPVIVANTISRIIKQGDAWNGTLKSVNNTLFARVAKTLELSQTRQYRRTKESHAVLGVIGFESIVNFLYKMSSDTFVDSQQGNGKSEADLPSENVGSSTNEEDNSTRQKLSATKKPIWEEQSKSAVQMPGKKVSLQKMTVCDSSANGYSVSWNQTDTKTKIGDLFGIISEDKKCLEIAIIRRIVLSTNTECGGEFRFGAEVLGFESEIVYLSGGENKNMTAWAVFIPGIELIETPNTLIYRTGCFKIGEYVHIHRGDKIIFSLLLKELHSTSAISHVEVSFVDKVS